MDLKPQEEAYKYILLGGGIGIVIFLVSGTSPPLGEDFHWFVFGFWIMSLIAMSGLTFLPYFCFYKLSGKLIKKMKRNKGQQVSQYISIFIMSVSYWLYYESWQSVEGSSSSTSSVIFAVLPFYILIGGAIIYGICIAAVNENA